MKKVPYLNEGTSIVHIDGKAIRPGDTREVDPSQIPGFTPPEQAAPTVDDPIQELLAMKIPEIVAALPQMSPEDYAAVKEAENAFGNPRKGLRKAFAEEDLRRANEQASAQTGETETQGTDSDNVNKTTGAADDEPTNSANAG